jgi:hypothetical protein
LKAKFGKEKMQGKSGDHLWMKYKEEKTEVENLVLLSL